jgi:hypothetical protein
MQDTAATQRWREFQAIYVLSPAMRSIVPPSSLPTSPMEGELGADNGNNGRMKMTWTAETMVMRVRILKIRLWCASCGDAFTLHRERATRG